MKFNSIELTLKIGCKLDCKYCPQSKLINTYYRNNPKRESILTFENFKKCLKEVVKGGGITFSGMSEPFLNPECSRMIKYADEQGYKVSLLTTLVGMTEEDFQMIRNIAFDHVTLHIPDQEGNSKFEITDAYLNLLKRFLKDIPINVYSCHGIIHEKVAGLLDNSKIIADEMMNRSGNLEYEELETYSPKGEIVCQIGTAEESGCWAPEILPDGTVTLCCMDYSMSHILGNIFEQSAEEILNSPEYLEVVEGMKDDKKKILCRECSSACEVKNLPSIKLKTSLENIGILNQYKLNEKKKDLIKRIDQAENICVLGLGKLFRDKFFNFYWDKALNVNILSDNNSEVLDYYRIQKGDEFQFVPPCELKRYPGLLVITHTKNPKELNKLLEELGITNYMNIYDIYNLCNSL